jgi:hypothetical protein
MLRIRRAAESRAPAKNVMADVALDELTALIGEFAASCEWKQFYTPKNLAMALAGEVGER